MTITIITSKRQNTWNKTEMLQYHNSQVDVIAQEVKYIIKLDSSRSPQVPSPRQSYSPGGVTIFTLPVVPLCPL